MNLLITGAWQQANDHFRDICKMGHEIVFMQRESDILPCNPTWVEGVICNGLFLSHPIQQFINLRYIQLTSAGFDRIPMSYIQEKNIEIHNARGVYSIPMAEFTIAGVLSLYKELGKFCDQQKEHKWEKRRELRELAGQTIVIVGCGSVGTECAKRFKAFGCKVVGVDLFIRKDELYDKIVPLQELDEYLKQADVVVLTVPLTEQTEGLIDNMRLKMIRGILVNISRGAVIDQTALENWGGEAVLDVFENEPLIESSSLWNKQGIIITPHNSFVGDGNARRIVELIMNNLRGIK